MIKRIENTSIKTSRLCLFLFLLSSCSGTHDYYSGTVLDELGRPVENVLVKENLAEKYALRKLTDKKGYFKFKRSKGVLPQVLFSKEGFLTDTIELIWTHAGESYEYANIIKEDSAKFILRGKNIGHLTFNYEKIPKPVFNTMINSKYDKNKLYGIWLKNGDKDLEGFKLNEKEYYAFGYTGNRYMRYTVHQDTITLYKDDYYYNRKGIIQSVEDNKLTIRWNKNETVNYERYIW